MGTEANRHSVFDDPFLLPGNTPSGASGPSRATRPGAALLRNSEIPRRCSEIRRCSAPPPSPPLRARVHLHPWISGPLARLPRLSARQGSAFFSSSAIVACFCTAPNFTLAYYCNSHSLEADLTETSRYFRDFAEIQAGSFVYNRDFDGMPPDCGQFKIISRSSCIFFISRALALFEKRFLTTRGEKYSYSLLTLLRQETRNKM